MKIDISKEWCMSMAQHESDEEIGVGLLAMDPLFDGELACDEIHVEEGRMAFGRFINMARRSKQYSIEKLAEEADVDIGELMSIEDDARYYPEPRTIYQLAKVLSVSRSRLMELSGLTCPKDDHIIEEAVRYAARSKSMEELSDEEKDALDGFIAVLSDK